MTKLILIFLFLTVLSCEKDSKTCWNCQVRNNKTNILIESIDYCNMTADEVKIASDPYHTTGISYIICYNKH
jgi:hypothetical protein